MTAQTASGAMSFLSYALETASGTFQAPTDVLFWTSNNLEANYEYSRKNVAGGSRAAERIIAQGKMKIHGQLAHELYVAGGVGILKALLGMDNYISAITADTASAQISTTGNTSTIVLTTGNAGYLPGAFVTVGASGVNQEMVQVKGYNVGTKTLTTHALTINAAGAIGTAVQQVAQHQFKPIPAANAGSQLLPTLSLEDNLGRLYARRYAGALVSKYGWKGGKESADVTWDVIGTVKPTRPGSPTAFAPTAAETADLINTYTIVDGFIATAGDPTATGSSSVQMIPVDTWDVSYDNGIIEKPRWDGTKTYKAWPGIAKGDIKYSYVNEALRPAEWEDYIDALNTITVPFFAQLVQNLGTGASPTWAGYGIYCGTTEFVKSTEIKSINDVIGLNIESVPVAQGGDLMQVFVVNSVALAY